MASSRSSGVIAASGLLNNGVNRVNAITLLTDGTNAARAQVRDGLTGSDPIKIEVAAAGAALSQHFVFENPVYFETGMYVSISGTGASVIVFFGG